MTPRGEDLFHERTHDLNLPRPPHVSHHTHQVPPLTLVMAVA
ncbi:hypothetical protein [Metallosphaera yellowstonensis]|nr:hypothetical protein [Metallosphaera yellowstonensis]